MAPTVCAVALTLLAQVSSSENPRPEDVYCGSYSLMVALGALGIGPGSFEELEQQLGEPGPDGYSMLELDEVARSYGARTMAVETSLENLDWRPERFVCLTVINDHHYVLLYKVEGGKVFLCDAPSTYDLPIDTFESIWSRKALLLGPEEFLPEESIAARRAWHARVRAALIFLGVALPAFVVIRFGRSLARRRSAAVAILLAGSCGAGCSPESVTAPDERPTPGTRSPSLVVEPEFQDLGRIVLMQPNQSVEASVTLRNRGEEPVTIDTLIPSCECSDVRVDSKTIEPGGQSRLTVTIQLVNGDNDGGTRVVIHSSDPVQPVSQATFHWEARNALRADRRSLDLRRIRPGGRQELEIPVFLEHHGLCAACRIEASSDLPEMDCRVESLVSPSSAEHTRDDFPGDARIGSVQVSVAAGEEQGHRKGLLSVALTCGNEERAILQVPTTWRVESGVAARPERLFIGRRETGESVTRSFLVSSSEGLEFSILGVRSEEEGLLKSVRFDAFPALTHSVEVTLAPPLVEDVWTSVLVIETDFEEAPLLRLPVAGVSIGAGNSE